MLVLCHFLRIYSYIIFTKLYFLSLEYCDGTQSVEPIPFTPLLCPKNLLNFSKRNSLRKNFLLLLLCFHFYFGQSGNVWGLDERMNEYIVCINQMLMQMSSKQYGFCIDCPTNFISMLRQYPRLTARLNHFILF